MMLREDSLVYLLGGADLIREKIKSVFDLITLSNKGIKKASLDALVSHMGMTKKNFAEDILNLSVKTLERKKADDLLDRYTSSHIIEVTKVVAHAFEVFEQEEKMQKWLNTPNRALNQMKPVDLFYIPTGLAMVDNVLGRIEEGVYS
ncbi:putative toxin-antitoxin system antitoxin component (TIGR02293 family) [Pedobacter cryoconitis]|uniref:Putative toxin-antitoxin system antitoxin component (TIGR02293 family) n=1 Tax=Pedobacter cryoconitis TaxID=188932 RepID=A0A7W8YUL0_9SPHI|nr:antitoxin Xre/MbcA/ParS toxin-binding domain-containing protein [Pedobacter cryoconitis]MBB5622099.1 putative toxin-antitoxin system antitoxin component (TIGR02293 family) [Pedobacter cryoconitis]MBB5646879.1 putative toxin-antitoxin system antitoxin component (TIGR02293 family) [Pedobacter cryoconitis]